MSTNALIEIDSFDALTNGLGSSSNNKSKKAVLLFGADWHEACPMLKMVLNALAQSNNSSSSSGTNDDVLFGNIDAENVPELSEKYNVTMVPTVILLLNNNSVHTVWERLEGEVLSDPSHVTLAVQRLIQARTNNEEVDDNGGTTSSSAAAAASALSKNNNNHHPHDPKQALNDRLERLIRGDTVMLFMKGNPNKPQCGFSRQAIELLNENEVPFGSFDILSDEDVRQELKVYSDWPTYPQIVRI
jgi:glutaredoxin-related protein